MKLELKHLAPYLPYGVKYHLPLESDRFDSIMENEPFKLALPLMSVKDKEKYLKKYENMFLYQKQAKVMWENGEIFLGQMQSSLGFEEDDVFLNEVKPILIPLSDINDGEENTVESISKCCYSYVQHLISKHYDVFGLIEKDLAIDINTLFH